MNETSNGSRPRSDLTVRAGLAVLFAGLAVTLVACPGPAPIHAQGGGGTGSSATATSSETSSTSVSSTVSSTATSSGGCTSDDDCPAVNKECDSPACEGGLCVNHFAPAKTTPCSSDGGQYCDGAGMCVSCILDTDCVNTSTTSCSGTMYTPTVCQSGKCVAGTKQDCALQHLVCTKDGCDSCTSDLQCGLPTTTICTTPSCDGTGHCGTVDRHQGADCAIAGSTVPGACDGSGTCVLGRYVFVTSSGNIPPTFTPLTMADKACADAASLANLDGKWFAWISGSDPASSPSNRFQKSMTAPYLLLDGTVIANNWGDLTDGILANMHGINLDEHKMPPVMGLVWTGTHPDGTATGASCGDWGLTVPPQAMVTLGAPGTPDPAWSEKGTTSCAGTGHLYCFQQ